MSSSYSTTEIHGDECREVVGVEGDDTVQFDGIKAQVETTYGFLSG